MSFPTFKLFESDGVTPVYEFKKVVDINPPLNADGIDFSEHNALRGQGGIITEGSIEPYDLTIEFVLIAIGTTDQEKYINLIIRMKEVRDTILTGTKYVFKMDTSLSETEITKVKRTATILFPLDDRQKILNFQRVIVNFRANVWN